MDDDELDEIRPYLTMAMVKEYEKLGLQVGDYFGMACRLLDEVDRLKLQIDILENDLLERDL